MPKPRPAFRLHPGPEKWILDTLKINGQSKKRTRIPGTTRRISLPRIFLLMHHQVRPNLLRHSPRKNRIIVLAEEDPNNKAKTSIFLPLASTPLLSGKTRTRIRTKKTSLTLSATLVSRKAITQTSVPRKSQKTSIGLDDLHVGD